jgi:S1-C subfamily serine protease
METELDKLSAELARAVDSAAASVAAVEGRPRYPSSGVFWAPDAIVTAAHTIQREEEITVALPSGRRVPATLAGSDGGTDIAVLRLAEPVDAVRIFDRAPLPKPGHVALAIGRSPDSGVNATMGIISAVSGPWRTWRGGLLDQYIRLDLTLYPGSSGGAVIDTSGRLIGIATSALSRIAGLAIPVSTVARVADELLSRGYIRRAYLGVGLQPVTLPEALVGRLKLSAQSGLIILSLEPEGPAAKAGLMVGDILTALDGKPLAETDEVQSRLAGIAAGQSVLAALVRGGERVELPIAVGEWPRKR